MADPSLDLLVLSDLHTIREAEHVCPIAERDSSLGPLLLRKALWRLRHAGVEPGLVVLLGDLVDDGRAPGAEKDLAAVAAEARALEIPFLAVPGNHDGDPVRFSAAFGCEAGFHEVGGYGFLLFHDHVGEGNAATRPAEGLELPGRAAAERPGLPLVALQHNPLHPPIEDEYPYMLTNGDRVLAGYGEAGVLISLSGHYHAGQPAHRVGDVTFATIPAACEKPFRFAHVRLRGREVSVQEHALRMDVPGLVDVHCHTQYAYCAAGVTAGSDVRVSGLMGLAGVCLVEHAFQLYFDEEVAWSYRWQSDDDLVHRAWKAGRGRMPEYRAHVRSLRGESVRAGLEVDLRADGSLLLAEEDREGWDLLVGAVHAIPGVDRASTTQAQAEQLFLREVERLCRQPIQVLAHPFRFFRRAGLECPVHLYGTVADELAQHGVAAEVNFHVNDPDPRFVEACLSRGVRIALATDSHDPAEVGELYPHLRVLREAGVRDRDLVDVLYRPQPG